MRNQECISHIRHFLNVYRRQSDGNSWPQGDLNLRKRVDFEAYSSESLGNEGHNQLSQGICELACKRYRNAESRDGEREIDIVQS